VTDNARLTLVVMAAGVGSRYGDAKQVDGVGPSGETLMDYSVFDASRAGFGKTVFVVRPEHEDLFRRQIVPRYEGVLDVALAFQRTEGAPATRRKPWGTGHAILSAAGEVSTPFAVVNADDYYGHRSFQLLADFLSKAAAGNFAMVGYRLDRTLSEHGFVSRGVCDLHADGTLRSIVERVHVERTANGLADLDKDGNSHPLTGEEIVSLNLWGLEPSVFPHLTGLFSEFLRDRGGDPKAEFFFPFAVDALIRSGRVKVHVLQTEDAWFGLTYRQDRETAVRRISELVDQGVYPRKLW
jgi:hypothetical protein